MTVRPCVGRTEPEFSGSQSICVLNVPVTCSFKSKMLGDRCRSKEERLELFYLKSQGFEIFYLKSKTRFWS